MFVESSDTIAASLWGSGDLLLLDAADGGIDFGDGISLGGIVAGLQSQAEAVTAAVLLPSLCSCLRSELGLPEEGSDAATVDRACDMVGLPQAGTPVRRARACLVALGV